MLPSLAKNNIATNLHASAPDLPQFCAVVVEENRGKWERDTENKSVSFDFFIERKREL